ncbi:MAG TPA: hypothetical protein VGW57_08940 [Chthoniobacterales bacterium]|nr:hypothetical protein [Chthoniobacterales bacterium]
MSIYPKRCYVIGALVLATFVAAPARALILDWNAVTWSNASPINGPGNNVTYSNSYDLNGDSQKDITVAVIAGSNNILTNDPASGSMTPVINESITGGQAAGQKSLMIAGDLFTHSDLTVQLSFFGGYAGANNVSFTIFDIDTTTNNDIISGIYGVTANGTQIAPTVSNVGSNVNWTGTGLGQTLEGNGASANNTSNGNVTLNFGSTIITSVLFTFSNTAGAPRYQDIAIGDITFTPVPEINPAAASVVSCLAAAGLTLLMHRRRKEKVGVSTPSAIKP